MTSRSIALAALGALAAALPLSAACSSGTITTAQLEAATGHPLPTAAPSTTAPLPTIPEELRRLAAQAGAGSSVPGAAGAGAPASGSSGAPAASGGLASVGYGDGLTAVAVAQALSRHEAVVLHAVNLYDGYAIVELAPSAAPARADRFTIRPNAVSGPAPVAAADASAVFGAADVRWDVIPSLLAPTVAAVGAEGGRVSHVIVERNVPFSNDVVIRVYVTGPRGGGRVDHFADGRPKQTFKD